MPSVQIHVPISPTPSFFTMVHCLAASLRAFAGAFSDARLIVSVGADTEPYDIDGAHPELRPYGITWRWVDRQLFRQHSYFATGLDRWVAPFSADYVVMADADLLITGPLDDLLSYVDHPKSIAGVIATKPPFTARGDGADRERWPALYRAAGLQPPPFEFDIPGYGIHYPLSGIAKGPAYYNFGFVIGARHAMSLVARTFERDYLIADEFMRSILAAQAALGLSIVRNELRASALPLCYNFWSQRKYIDNFPDELHNVKVLHYLNGPFRKHHDNHAISDIAGWLIRNADSLDPEVVLVRGALSKTLDQIGLNDGVNSGD